MRYGHGAAFPQQRQQLPASQFHGSSHPYASSGAFHAGPRSIAQHQPSSSQPLATVQSAPVSARQNIARLFFDLRQALRLTPHQTAAHLMTVPDSIFALERGEFELMPDWSETCRIVIAYTNLAGIDGRPVLAAISEIVRETSASAGLPGDSYATALARLPQALPAQGQIYTQAYGGDDWDLPGDDGTQNTVDAGSKGRRRLIGKVKVRPDRVFYALSLPLALLLLLLNTSILRTVVSYLPRPAAEIVRDLRTHIQVQFAPVHDGFRWIDVSNPRDRRGDKLPTRRQSD